jgi:hypothetical protein
LLPTLLRRLCWAGAALHAAHEQGMLTARCALLPQLPPPPQPNPSPPRPLLLLLLLRRRLTTLMVGAGARPLLPWGPRREGLVRPGLARGRLPSASCGSSTRLLPACQQG